MEEQLTESVATSSQALPKRFQFRTFSSLGYLDYRYLWTGTLMMSAGQWVQQVALGWLVYELTGSSVLLGLLNGLRALPFLVTGPIAGVAADRMDRRQLMLRTQYVLIGTAFLMGTLVASGWLQVWHIFVFTLITGIGWSFSEPVRQSLIPSVVPKAELANAIALNSAGFNLMKVLGPALGGVMIAVFGAAGNFWVQGAAYVVVLWMIQLMHVPPTHANALRASAMANLKEGFAYVRSTPTVLALMILAYVPRIFAVPYQTLMPVFQKDVLQVGPEGLGLLMAAPGLGAVLAVLTLASISSRVKRQGLMLIASTIMLGLSLILFSQITSFHLALIVLVIAGAFQMVFLASTSTMLQLIVPDELRGRVMSLYMLDRGLMPAGALFAGVIAHVIGAPLTVTSMGAIVVVLTLLVAWRVPHIRTLES
ncbi:MAG: permease of the major facilitator superfamily [Deltaproteobacteria bacterium]|nr:permease of the major facilitator superfamily [Deltaproteobacteria bacterium]